MVHISLNFFLFMFVNGDIEYSYIIILQLVYYYNDYLIIHWET